MTQLNTLFTAWVETVYHRLVSIPRPGSRRSSGGRSISSAVLPSTWRNCARLSSGRNGERSRRASTVGAAREQVRSRRRPDRPQGRARVRPVRPHPHRGPLARPLDGAGRCRTSSAGTSTPRPNPTTRHHTSRRGPGSTTCTWSNNSTPPNWAETRANTPKLFCAKRGPLFPDWAYVRGQLPSARHRGHKRGRRRGNSR